MQQPQRSSKTLCQELKKWHTSTKASDHQILDGKITHVGLIELSVSGDLLLEAQEHELEPQIGQHQHE